MEVLNAIFEVVNNVPVHHFVVPELHLAIPLAVHEPKPDCGLIDSVLNSSFVQKIWGWTLAFPIIGKYILVPILGILVAIYWFGLRRMGSRVLRVILTAVLVTIAVSLVPTLLDGTNLFATC